MKKILLFTILLSGSFLTADASKQNFNAETVLKEKISCLSAMTAAEGIVQWQQSRSGQGVNIKGHNKEAVTKSTAYAHLPEESKLNAKSLETLVAFLHIVSLQTDQHSKNNVSSNKYDTKQLNEIFTRIKKCHPLLTMIIQDTYLFNTPIGWDIETK